jgi:hypothetical protein
MYLFLKVIYVSVGFQLHPAQWHVLKERCLCCGQLVAPKCCDEDSVTVKLPCLSINSLQTSDELKTMS